MLSPKYYLNLVSEPLDLLDVVKTPCCGVEEDDGLEAGKLSLVQVDGAERLNKFCHHSDTYLPNSGVLELKI